MIFLLIIWICYHLSFFYVYVNCEKQEVKMFKNSVFVFTVMFFILYGLSVNAQKDVKGSKDHPIISRYEGSYIIGYEQEDYDQLVMPAGPYEGDDTKKLTPEGKVTRILYAGPKGVTSFHPMVWVVLHLSELIIRRKDVH
jgi:hypothetical protein